VDAARREVYALIGFLPRVSRRISRRQDIECEALPPRDASSLWNAEQNESLLFGMKRTAEEVASTIEGLVNGTGNQWAWDGFTSIRLDDPELEAIRQKIVSLPTEFPPSNSRDYCSEAGMAKMRQLAQDLRARAKPSSR
jgi:hypothetical protein